MTSTDSFSCSGIAGYGRNQPCGYGVFSFSAHSGIGKKFAVAAGHVAIPMQRTSIITCCFAGIATFTAPVAARSSPANNHIAPIELSRGKPFVMIEINGKGPYRFVIDTGTGAQAFVTPALAQQLGLPTAGEAHLSDPSRQTAQSVRMVQIQALQVAGVQFNNVRAVVHSLNRGDGTCDGLLGFTLFRDYLLTLDFPNREMILSTGSLQPDGGNLVLPFQMPQGMPIIAMRVGNLKVDAEIDSGGEGLSLPQQIAPRLKYLRDPTVVGLGESLSTKFQIKTAKLASDVYFGDFSFARPCVQINAAFPLANFGSGPMKDFVLTFDQKNLLVRFEANRRNHELAATPALMRMVNAPPSLPPDPTLMPVD